MSEKFNIGDIIVYKKSKNKKPTFALIERISEGKYWFKGVCGWCIPIDWQDQWKLVGNIKPKEKIWHDIDEIPKFEMRETDDMRPYMVSDLIITSNYGHISGEAHYYTPESWSAHIGFEKERKMKWAYEKDLIDEA